MQIVICLARDRNLKCVLLQSGHAVITHPRSATSIQASLNSQFNDNNNNNNSLLSSSSSSSSITLSAAAKAAIAAAQEYDTIDIQVCISKELRQRILLVQFMKKIRFLESIGIGSLSVITGGGPMSASLNHNQDGSSSSSSSTSLKNAPQIRKFATYLKKQLIAAKLTLSSLYHISITDVCSLPKGLDIHFLAQLNSYVRDMMWTRLTKEYMKMDEHIQEQEELGAVFAKTLQPIYQ
jgi:hypothetical protein